MSSEKALLSLVNVALSFRIAHDLQPLCFSRGFSEDSLLKIHCSRFFSEGAL